MILYLYRDNFCDPAKNIGTAKLFSHADDLDKFLHFFVASIKADAVKRWRCFVTNDTVEFHEVDHYALMEDNFELDALQKGRIKEVNLDEVAEQYNAAYGDAKRAKRGAAERAKRAADASIREFVNSDDRGKTPSRD